MSLHRNHDRCGCSALRANSLGAGARPFAFAHSTKVFERDRPFNVTHTALEIALDVPNKSVHARAVLTVERTDPGASEITLDAVGFAIEKVSVNQAHAKHRYDGRSLVVELGHKTDKATIEIKYSATPRRGMYFISPDEHYPQRPEQVWTQCQEEDARHFLPCHDKPHMKMTFECTVTVPEGWRVLSNGELASDKTPKGAPWTFHWKMNDPLPSYLITIVAGKFAVLDARSGKVPLSYWVPETQRASVDRTFSRTPAMVKHFGELLGTPYPWNKYAQVVVSDFIFGGMENTTATTMYEHIMLDERATLDISSDDLIAHELAHHWFGDYVTCRDWSEGWLNEGFATYMEHAWREHHEGMDEYEYGLKTDLDGYVAEAHGRYRRAIVCQEYDSPLDIFDRHLYEKGALTLHTLRATLGKDVFYKGVAAYLTRHRNGVVETRDLQRALEEASGRSLGRFFDQAVYKAGHAELEVTLAWDNGMLTAQCKQQHHATDGAPATFDVPLSLLVTTGAKKETHKLHVTQKQETFALPCAERPTFVVTDPQMMILGEVSTKAPRDMLIAQLLGGATARARWLAAQSLSRSDDPTTIEALRARVADDKEFWGVRAEAAAALGKIRSKECERSLVGLTKVANPKVRRAVIEALGAFRTTQVAEALKPLALSDASYLAQAEAARALGKTRQPSGHDVLVELLERPSWADVVRVGALDGLAAARDDRALPHVLARTRYGHPTRARRAAIMALPKLAQDRRSREALEELLLDPDPYLRVDVVRALGEVGDGKARPALRASLETDLDPRVRRRIREVLRDLGESGKRATDQLKEELDKLLAEQPDLKARLSKLEASQAPVKTGSVKKKKKR